MGRSNIAVKQWFRNKKRFADLFNGTVFMGKQIIQPEELEEIDSESSIIITDNGGKEKGIQRYRDIVMRWKHGIELAILACESQNKIHYAMPVRTMIYDGLTYIDQIRKLWKLHEKDGKITDEEFLSRFRKEDKIFPVISLVFYYGLKTWNGNMDLYEMFYKGERIREQELMKTYIPNYPINLIDAGNMEDLGKFQTDLQVIFGMLKYKHEKDELLWYMKEHHSYFSEVDIETYQAIREILHSEKQLKEIARDSEGDEKVDMCKALEDLYEDGKSEGRSEGLREGRNEGLREGRNEGLREGLREGIRVLIETCKEFKVSKEEVGIRLCRKFLLSEEESEGYIEEYWV